MPSYSEEDKILIKQLRISKGWGARRMMNEFPDKPWSERCINYIISKIDETGTTDRREGSGRPRSVRIMRHRLTDASAFNDVCAS